MSETKRFSLRTILTVTTGRLLTKPRDDRDNGIDDLYKLLGWMTDDSPFTHQLGRFSDECKPVLMGMANGDFVLVNAYLCDLDLLRHNKATAIEMWLAHIRLLIPTLQDEYDVPKVSGHVETNPIEDLAAMMSAPVKGE